MNLTFRKIIAVSVIAALSIFVCTGCQPNPGQDENSPNENILTTPDVIQDPQNQTDTEKGKEEQPRVQKDVKVKGIYLTGWVAGISSRLDSIINLINRTELNAVVLDIKDDDGLIGYATEVPLAKEIRAYEEKYKIDDVIKKLKENNVYVIGRIVCFKDPVLASKRPEYAVKRADGSLWRENGRTPWTNAFNQDTWNYNIEIAKEAIKKGFDEIQFDYVRFPTPSRNSDIKYQSEITKMEAINGFLALAEKELSEGMGVKVSADVFGIICESPGDTENIGQNIETIGMDVDYISPMVYPSHYANAAQNGVGQQVNGVVYKAPDLEPYGVVYNSLMKAKDRISKVEGYKAKMRPYLQDFTASWLAKGYFQKYGAEQVKAQIQAVYDAGYEEWILWNPDNVYSVEALAIEQ